MSILHELLKLTAEPRADRLGACGQPPRRALERLVRARAVRFAQRLKERGASQAEVAQRLAIQDRTLRSWHVLDAEEAPQPLGRPLQSCDATQQQAVFDVLKEIGPGLGLPSLRTYFPDLARAELDDLLKDYRHQWRAANPRLLHRLHWQRAGAVWAIDFAEAPSLIDGCYGYVLAVRDLASGQTLLWQPVETLTAKVVVRELRLLFMLHGAPLVLKSDNGSAFIADVLRWELQRWGVGPLFSPPHCPEYNGAIEASIGALKRRTELQCLLLGHPNVWTSAALDAARRAANGAQTKRLKGQMPEQIWEARRVVTAEERAAFQATVARCRAEERAQRGLAAEAALSRKQEASVDRVAYRRALVAHDLLLFRRRRILPPITRPKVTSQG
ncbi:MAG TPA: transposase family protein [Gemmataceae bacterium]|nr:transposase family protein [Gemmataceae bacterium]